MVKANLISNHTFGLVSTELENNDLGITSTGEFQVNLDGKKNVDIGEFTRHYF